MKPERLEKIKALVDRRQGNITVILEDVVDMHNVGAVIRTCDSVGIKELYMIYSDPIYIPGRLKVGKLTSGGSRKWVDVHFYEDMVLAFEKIRTKYDRVLATHLGETSKSIHEIDLTASVAILFGNETRGVSQAAMRYVDANILIPQMGMVQSLNISVACAVTLYEAYRQRMEKGLYTRNTTMTEKERADLLTDYMERSKNQHIGEQVIR